MSHDASVERPHVHPELAVGDALDSPRDQPRRDQPSRDPASGEAGGRDLLGIGLAIYFVILIAIVAGMLILSTLMPDG
jgi:hypothetical protein